MHYANPAVDRLIQRVYETFDERESARLLKEFGELIAADMAVLPLHFGIEFAAARKGVRVILDDFPSGGATSYTSSRSAHLWDRD